MRFHIPYFVFPKRRVRWCTGTSVTCPPCILTSVGRNRCMPLNSGSARDRKSTRLNSSHSQISYAVFCLKKKKKDALETPNVATSRGVPEGCDGRGWAARYV